MCLGGQREIPVGLGVLNRREGTRVQGIGRKMGAREDHFLSLSQKRLGKMGIGLGCPSFRKTNGYWRWVFPQILSLGLTVISMKATKYNGNTRLHWRLLEETHSHIHIDG